jgi:hypothetical protein
MALADAHAGARADAMQWSIVTGESAPVPKYIDLSPLNRRKMRRRYWVATLAIPLLMVAGDLIYWGVASDRLRAGYQDWLAARRAEGWEVASTPVSIGGWPRAAAVTVSKLTLHHSGPNIPGDLRVASAGLTLSVSLLRPADLNLSLAGPLHVQIGDLPDVVMSAGECLVTLPMMLIDPMPVGMQARDLRLQPVKGSWQLNVGSFNLQAEIAAGLEVADQSRPAARFTLSSEAISLPGTMKSPLGSNISSLSLDGAVNGKLPQTGDNRSGDNRPGDIRQWAMAWRDDGGSLEITHLAMGWGPLGLAASATLALDDQLQPMGSGSGRLVGYAETLDRLAAAAILTRSAATAAKAVLSLMAGTPDGDTPLAVDVPLTLQYRTLSMRQVPLVRLPELDWPVR